MLSISSGEVVLKSTGIISDCKNVRHYRERVGKSSDREKNMYVRGQLKYRQKTTGTFSSVYKSLSELVDEKKKIIKSMNKLTDIVIFKLFFLQA